MSDPEGDSEADVEPGTQDGDDPLASFGRQAEEEEDRPEEPEPNPLTTEILAESLSMLCKTGNALAHAYVHISLKDRELTDINALRPFIHLRYVDVSGNLLRDLSPLANLSQLLWLNAEGNRLTSACLEELPFLQVASFARNRVRDTEGISHPLLETLNLSHNQIRAASLPEPLQLSRLQTLELRGNLLETTRGIELPHLRHLYLAANNINRLDGLDSLVGLQTLHLRDNHIESLEGFSEKMVSLQYLNVRGNLIVDIRQMNKLQCLPKLRVVVIAENPCTEEDAHRLETLMALPTLGRLDKEAFTPDERLEAAQALRQRRREERERMDEDPPTAEEPEAELG